MSSPVSTPASSSVPQSSNLLQYRALFQVFTYARLKRQSAEQLVRDAMTGGVVVPFSLISSSKDTTTAAAVLTSPAAVSAQSSRQSGLTPSPTPEPTPSPQPQPPPSTMAATAAAVSTGTNSERRPLLLLPSSKCVATLATLIADGFFNITPLASTAEKVRGIAYQHRSECEARDYFTLIALLYPDCFVPEAVPRTLMALRRADSSPRAVSPSTSLLASSTTAAAGHSWKSPPPPPSSFQDKPSTSLTQPAVFLNPVVISEGDTCGEQGHRPAQQPAAQLPSSLVAESRAGVPSVLPGVLLSPTQSAMSESTPESARVQHGSSSSAATATPAATTAAAGSSIVPEVDSVPLTAAAMDDLLLCRRSIATVLLSSLNEALHDVQYRELERGKPADADKTTKAAATAHPTASGEAAALQCTAELLLTAKMVLMCVMAAAEVWRQRLLRAAHQNAVLKSGSPANSTTTAVSSVKPEQHQQQQQGQPTPYALLYDLLDHDDSTSHQFTAVAVEEWGWGKDKEELGQWYDRTLDRLVQSAEAVGVKLDAFLQLSKTVATQRGRAVSRSPALLLHRPMDGGPAVELNLSFMHCLNTAIALPVMPVQPGEVQILLHPCLQRSVASTSPGKNKSAAMMSRGHELLFDGTASPTADFLQICVTVACPATMLQASGGHVPPLFRHRPPSLSLSEITMVKTFLADPTLLGAFVEKNAPLLARLTLWCDGQWPPESATLHWQTPTQRLACAATNKDGNESTPPTPSTNEAGYEMAALIKESVMFLRPFSAAVGRYVREMVVLNGFDQVTLERWIRHICADIAQGGPYSIHRTSLAALVKFAALQRKWTWTSEVAELQKQYLP